MNIENLEKLPNKQFAYSCIQLLKNKNVIKGVVLNNLIDGEQCHNLFSCSSGFPILLEVKGNLTKEELNNHCHDSNGRQRYYKEVVEINNKYYVITNHWYGPNKSMQDNRTPFLLWVQSITK